ncbi:DUF1254 domain-containing protein [Streptomyces cyaneofuscatus]|uniref:DUF1254 domain-containing protein n=1 Tax=Streptomyces cyaneofuscatus TaxID=66883 RepID=UPI0033253A6A
MSGLVSGRALMEESAVATVFEREENAYTLAVQAGLWGYPLGHRVEVWNKTLEVKGVGRNALRRFERLKTADDRFIVTPNNLTIDAYALIDTTHGPVVLFVPQLESPRWSIMQVDDAFDDVTANLGGIKGPMPGAYVVTGPNHTGRIPAGLTRIPLRTVCGEAAVRIQVNGEADLPAAVHELRGFRVMPLRDYLDYGLALDAENYDPLPFADLSAPTELEMFDRLGAAMQYLLPTSLDTEDTFIQSLAAIGLSVGRGFAWQDLDPSVRAGLVRAAPVVEQITDERWQSMGTAVNGWRGSLSSGRCSYDFALNAANTKNQIGTEIPEEVVYLNCRIDADGKPLDGANAYRIRFEAGATPPVTGMWNLALYGEDMLFTANDAHRFSIGTTTEDLHSDLDGSLTLYIQNGRPEEPGQVANWLPAPHGPFNLTMRFYAPLAPVLDQSYRLPPVHRAHR